MTLTQTPGMLTRWAVLQGLPRAALRRAARQGNLDARLMVEPGLQADPYPHYERLRADYPLARGGLAWATAHHDVCTEVLRGEDFTVARPQALLPTPVRALLRISGRPYLGPIDPPSMLAVDPPDHTRYRKLVTRAFTAKAVAGLRTRTGVVADELLDELTADPRVGPVDLVARYAALLPVTIISEILGVPTSMREQFLTWGDGAASALDIGLSYRRYARSQQNLAALTDWFSGHFSRLRDRPGDDMLSRLVAALDEDGGRLTEQELLATAMLVLGAGFETTVNLISNGAALLFAHPDQRAVLAGDPSLWPNAVDEMLRFDPPVQRTARRVRQDTELRGARLTEGDFVVTLLAAANRDPRHFTDPNRFDVRRPDARDHLAFSSGIHFCLGAALARMEGEVALRRLFERLPELAPAGPGVRRPTRVLRGYESLPVRRGTPAHAPSADRPAAHSTG